MVKSIVPVHTRPAVHMKTYNRLGVGVGSSHCTYVVQYRINSVMGIIKV